MAASAQTVKILFNSTKAETAGNADWVIDADLHNIGYTNGPPVVGQGSESNPQQIPTPAQSNITSSTSETYWNGGISAWGIDLVKKGYIVETLPYNGTITYGNSSNPQDLSNYKVFVDCEPNILYTTAEKTAIIQFVQNGGGLFMVSDHTISDRNNDGYDSPVIWNDLMSNNGIATNPFGITFDLANFSQTTTNIPTLPGDPILHGIMGDVTSAMWSNGTSITMSPTANSSVKGIIYKTGSSFGNTGVMFAYASYGNGKVVALGDSSPCDDGTGDSGDVLYNGWTGDAGGNHEKLIMNATIWLAASSSPVPVVVTTAATSVTLNAATLNGTVNPRGVATTYHFDWGLTTSYGNTTTAVSAGSGSTAATVSAAISGLVSGTTYHFRISAVNSFGTSNGADMTFNTACASSGLPFSESFSGTTIPACWSQADHQGNNEVWAFGTITGITPLPTLTGNYAYLNSDAYGSGNSQNADLVTPLLDLTSYTTVNLAFKHYFKWISGSTATLSYTTNNGSTWTTIATYTATSTTNPTLFSQAVNAVAGQSQVKFRWNFTGTWGYYWAIDDVQITGTICTPQPVAVSVTASANPSCQGSSVTFTATSTNGGTTPAYQWKVNGVNAGTNSPSYSYIPSNQDIITCSVTSNATCISGNPATSGPVTVTVTQVTPSISGTATSCQGTTETYSTETGMTVYSWNISSGGQVTAGSGTNSINVNWMTSGSQSVSVNYTTSAGCSAVTPANLSVSVAPIPAQLFLTNVSIQAGSQDCELAQSITAGGNDYTFLVEAGASSTVIARDSIRFLPGTTVLSTGYMHAYITDQCVTCSSNLLAPVHTSGSSDTDLFISQQLAYPAHDDLKVYPNPFREFVILENTGETSESEEISAEVYNTQAEKLFSCIVPQYKKAVLSFEGRTAGIYFVRIISGKSSKILKIIKL